MPQHIGFEGLHRVRMQTTKAHQPITVGSFDDHFNVVGGLDLKQRLRMLRAIDVALSMVGTGPGRQTDDEKYVLWALHDVNHRLMAAKRLRWTGHAGEGGQRMRPGFCVLNLLPPAARRPDMPGARIARLVGVMRARLEREVFGEGVFASNHDLQAACMQALRPDSPEAPMTPRRLVRLPDGRGSFSHKSLAQVLRYYGIGRSAMVRRRRGYMVSHWHLRQLLGLSVEGSSFDLRALPWRHGAYALKDAQA